MNTKDKRRASEKCEKGKQIRPEFKLMCLSIEEWVCVDRNKCMYLEVEFMQACILQINLYRL